MKSPSRFGRQPNITHKTIKNTVSEQTAKQSAIETAWESKTLKNVLLTAWLAMNVFTFSLYGADKRKAKRGVWRIPEKMLLTCTWLFGGVGALVGMRMFHHKTKHRAFTISAPIAAAISVVAALCVMMM